MDVTLLPFLALEQHTTFPFFQGHGWSILHQSFAWWVASSNYADPKTVLDNVQKHNQYYHLSTHIAFWKDSMINRLSNLINRNRSAAKISQVLCSSVHPASMRSKKSYTMKLSFTFRLGKTALLPENHDMQVYQLFGLEPFPQSIYIWHPFENTEPPFEETDI